MRVVEALDVVQIDDFEAGIGLNGGRELVDDVALASPLIAAEADRPQLWAQVVPDMKVDDLESVPMQSEDQEGRGQRP